MTSFGKVLAGALFFMSVAFLAVSAVLLAAEYPWGQHDDDLPPEYQIVESKKENKSIYTVRRTFAGNLPGQTDTNKAETIGQPSENKAQAIITANNAETSALKAKATGIDTAIQQLKLESQQLQLEMTADATAMESTKVLLEKELKRIRAALLKVQDIAHQTAIKIETIDKEEKVNRRILARLKAEYEQLEADRERLESQHVELVDTLRRLVFSLANLQRRNRQLKAASQ